MTFSTTLSATFELMFTIVTHGARGAKPTICAQKDPCTRHQRTRHITGEAAKLPGADCTLERCNASNFNPGEGDQSKIKLLEGVEAVYRDLVVVAVVCVCVVTVLEPQAIAWLG